MRVDATDVIARRVRPVIGELERAAPQWRPMLTRQDTSEATTSAELQSFEARQQPRIEQLGMAVHLRRAS